MNSASKSKLLILSSTIITFFGLLSNTNAFKHELNCVHHKEIPEAPTGIGYEISVPEPEINYPLPVQDNFKNQTGKDFNGNKLNQYDKKYNPIIQILSGFDSIWSLGDEKWHTGGANGSGPSDYSKVRIINNEIWVKNMEYVLTVTKNRSDEAALAAYLDDRRHQHYSIIDGLGPLSYLYKKGSGATTTINHTLNDLNINEIITYEENDAGTGPGKIESELGDFISFMAKIRGPEGTTSPAKYFYSSPRPWRMNDKGDVIQTGKDTIGNKTYESYESNVDVVPALLYVRETRGRQKDGGFPSGHTNAAYLSAFAYAYAIPERFSEMLTRASELGENRIVSGMHSPLDVIGGRIMSTAVAAAYLNAPENTELKNAAYKNMHDYLEMFLPGDMSLFEYSQSDDKNDKWSNDNHNKRIYSQRMVYNFCQDKRKAGMEMVVPKGAEVLLETRLPYLTANQRRAVLYTTGIGSGYPLLDDCNGWGRLNLVKAADGYGSFVGDVHVIMDAEKGGFNKIDSWDNDIHGPGMLTKNGTGTLILTGYNSYNGGTVINEGTLIGRSNYAFGKNDVYMKNGKIESAAPEKLNIFGNYTHLNGVLRVNIHRQQSSYLNIHKKATILNGTLEIVFDNYKPGIGQTFRVILAKEINGKFDDVKINGYKVRQMYTKTSLIVCVIGKDNDFINK